MGNWVKNYLEQNPDVAALPVAKRSRFALHVQRPGHERLAFVSGAPMHYYESGSRAWLPLDTKLQVLGDGSFGAPGLPFRFGQDGEVSLGAQKHSHKTQRVGVMVDGRFQELATLGVASPADDRLVREAAGFRHETILLPNGLREELILEEAPKVDGSSGILVMESDVPRRSFPDGWVDEHKEGGFNFPPGWAEDADGVRIPVMRWTEMVDGRQKLYSGVPLEWMEKAKYPVVIDPDIELEGDSADGNIEGVTTATSTSSGSTATSMNIGSRNFSSSQHVWRGYIKFDTSSLGPSAIVERARIKTYVMNWNTNINWSIYVRQYNWAANDPMAAGTREAAWDGLAAASNTVLFATQAIASYTHVTSPDLPTDWVEIEANTYYGFWCNQEGYQHANGQGSLHAYATAEHATPEFRPLMIIEYLAGYPRGGPLSLKARFPAALIKLQDTRIKLRARARNTSLNAMGREKDGE
jgi:hypothetical protein